MAATKQTGVPCYDKAADDEPLFVIRAADPAAADTVRDWAYRAQALGHRAEKIAGALKDADDIEVWQRENPGRVKRPD